MENNLASCLSGTQPPATRGADGDRRLHDVKAQGEVLARLKADMAQRHAVTSPPARRLARATTHSGDADISARQTYPPAANAGAISRSGPATSDPVARDGHPAWLLPGALHDVFAASVADGPAVHGFAAGHAIRIAAGRPVVWAFHDMAGHELGRPHGEGLADLGLDPAALLLVRARTVPELLGAAEEAARYSAVGVVIISAWGAAKAFDLTASRRLALVSARSGVAILCVRIAAAPTPGAAWSRWSVRAAASRRLEGDAPGHPAFSITLLRHRGGAAPATWILEWDRAQRTFRERIFR